MASLFTEGKFQGLDASGAPLAGGKLYSYAAGTLTPKATYTTQAGTVANANPVILDSSGRAAVWLGSGAYRMVLKDADDVTVWDADNIGGTDSETVTFTASGTGAVIRTVQDKLREWVSVKDWGAVGDGSTDDTAAIQAAIDANPGRTIVFPHASYRITSKVSISASGTRLLSIGRATIYANTGGDDGFHFYCSTNGQWEYLNNCSLAGDWYFSRPDGGTVTTGAAIRLTRCGGFSLSNAYSLNWADGLVIEGGKDFQIHALRLALSPSAPDRTATTDSALLKIVESPTAGGTYQPAWTVRITNLQASANYRTQATLFVGNADGLQLTNAYITGGKYGILRFRNQRAGAYIASVTISDVYLDAVNYTTGANTCIDIPADGLASNVYNIDVSNSFLGNCVSDAVLVAKTITELKLTGCTLANVGGSGVNFTGSAANVGNLALTGNKFQSTGIASGASSAVRVGNAAAVSLVGNKFESHSGTDGLIRFDGTIADATLTGNTVRISSGADFQNVGTVGRISYAGNNSNLSGSTLCGIRPGNRSNADTLSLDWYEEGTFTPTVTFGGLSTGVAYTTQIGQFTRIGNRVHFNIRLVLSSKGSATGAMLINGLPYSAGTAEPVAHRIQNIPAGLGELSAFIGSGAASVQLGYMGAAATSVTQFTDASVNASLDVQLSGTYIV